MTANVDLTTGEFLTDGALYDNVRYVRVTVGHTPDPRTEKWNGSAIVSKSAAEIAAFDQASRDTRVDAEIDRTLNSIDDMQLQAIAELMKDTIDKVNAGTFRAGDWKRDVRRRTKQLRRGSLT
jgi:hypothetical protein